MIISEWNAPSPFKYSRAQNSSAVTHSSCGISFCRCQRAQVTSCSQGTHLDEHLLDVVQRCRGQGERVLCREDLVCQLTVSIIRLTLTMAALIDLAMAGKEPTTLDVMSRC